MYHLISIPSKELFDAHNKHYAFHNGENRRNLLSKELFGLPLQGDIQNFFTCIVFQQMTILCIHFKKPTVPFIVFPLFYLRKYYTMAFIFCKGFFKNIAKWYMILWYVKLCLFPFFKTYWLCKKYKMLYNNTIFWQSEIDIV